MSESLDIIAQEIAALGHVHECEEWRTTGDCIGHPCRCACGAVQDIDHTRKELPYAWRSSDGTLSPWPDPAERGE